MSFIRKLTFLALITAFATVVFFACNSVKGYKSSPSKNINHSGESNNVETKLVAFHTNDSITEVYFEISTENLMYKKMDTNQVFYANVSIACKLLPDINSRSIIDSASQTFFVKYNNALNDNVIEGKFTLKLKQPNYSYLDVWLIDRNKNIKYSYALFINKRNNLVEQNYLFLRNDKIAYKNTFFKGEEITVISNANNKKSIMIDCFYKDFGLALPPFSLQKQDEMKYRPDSTFKIVLNDKLKLTMPNNGFFHLKADAQFFDGASIFTYEKSYPGVNDIDEMINCTRYIMRKEEFEECKNAPNPKAAIDNFWLSIAGSNERAKELLKKYYGRVREANKKYTSYTQGWKTDRGMISIIFGETINTYSSKNDEIWVYGPETDANALRFIFKKTDNPFSNNDYVLQRSALYKEPWYTAVEYWRQGKIFIQKQN